jgi:hypothetical protein
MAASVECEAWMRLAPVAIGSEATSLTGSG